MQFWNWFFLATAVLTTAKPTEQLVDISTLPECMQQCMRQEDKHFDIELARKKRVCKKTSPKIWKFQKWYNNEFRPCLKNQCGYEIWQGPEMLAFHNWLYDLCGYSHDDE